MSDAATVPSWRAAEPSWHPAGRWLTAPDLPGRVHVVSLGTGPEHVVLLHGLLQSSWAWRHNLAALAEHFTVHAVCLPGAGWSEKPAVAYDLGAQADRLRAVWTALGIERGHVVGNSLGAALALRLAVDHPQCVGRLLLVDPAGPGTYAATLVASVQHPIAAPLLKLPGLAGALRLALQWGAYPRMAVDADVMVRFLAPLRAPGGARAALAMAQAFPRDVLALEASLASVRQPVLLTWGCCDRVVPLAAVQRLQRGLADSRLELYDCSGHCPMEEEPVRFNREAIAFLAGHAQPDRAAA